MAKALTITPSFKEIKSKILALITDKDARRRVLTRAVLELKDHAAAYPTEGSWNKAPGARGNNRWYQRQFGSRWKRADGSLGGVNNSQRLQKSWQTEIQRADEFSASTFTEVTYAPFLLDDNRRVHWANSHGWQTLDEIEEDYTPRFEKIILDEIDKQIDKI